MAGHSKWANIKHRKAAQDAKKGKIYTQYVRTITLAARDGGGDLEMNSTLRMIVQKAKKAGVPNDKIDRAIKVGTGEIKGEMELTEVLYEGYGPGGVAILVQTLTDNTNRTVANVRHIFSKYGGSMGTSGCVAYLFDYKGVFIFVDAEKEKVEECAIMNGAEDIFEEDGTIVVYTSRDDYRDFTKAVLQSGLEPEDFSLSYVPQMTADISEEDNAKVSRLIEMLEEDDDVQNVYVNLH